MKVLIFSDSHLSDTFNERKFHYLSNIIKPADKVIINGDFWEGEKITLEQFVTSHWNHLFPLLKARNAVYIYGNHDRVSFSTDQVQLFSNEQAKRFIFKSGDKEFIVEHGNRFSPITGSKEDEHELNPIMKKVAEFTQKQIIEHGLEKKLFQRFNNKIKREIKKELKENQIYVCGHTHCAEIDLEHQFVNTGLNHYGIGQYAYVENGVITLHEERYA